MKECRMKREGGGIMKVYVGQRKRAAADGWCCGKVVVVVESEGERRTAEGVVCSACYLRLSVW